MTLQVTVSVGLLIAAGLFIHTLQNIRGLDLGLASDSIVSAGISPSRFGANAVRSAAYIEELVEGVRSAPGISSAAFSWTTSFSSNRANALYTRPEDPSTPFDTASSAVSPGFFATMGIPIIAGRDFTDAESRGPEAPVVIISQAMARRAFPTGSPVGSQLTLRFPKGKTVEIVGDVRGKTVTKDPEPWSEQRLFARTSAVAIAVLTLLASLVPAVRAARVDPVRSLRVDA